MRRRAWGVGAGGAELSVRAALRAIRLVDGLDMFPWSSGVFPQLFQH